MTTRLPWRTFRPVASPRAPHPMEMREAIALVRRMIGPFNFLIAALIVARGVRLPDIRVTRRELRGWWAAIVGWRTSIHIGIRRIIPRGTAVRVIIPTRRRIVLDRAAARGRAVAAPALVVILPTTGRGAVTIGIAIARVPARAVATGGAGGRATTVIVFPRGRVATARGSGASTIATRHIWLRIGNAGDTRTFELTTVKLLHGGPQVRSRLKLNEAFAISVTACFRVNNIKAGLACEIFQVLKPESV